MGIVMYSFYYYWRHHGGHPSGVSFAFYCLFATIYSAYACTWVCFFRFSVGSHSLNVHQDFLMDWSLFKMHVKYPLLREELLAADYIPVRHLVPLINEKCSLDFSCITLRS